MCVCCITVCVCSISGFSSVNVCVCVCIISICMCCINVCVFYLFISVFAKYMFLLIICLCVVRVVMGDYYCAVFLCMCKIYMCWYQKFNYPNWESYSIFTEESKPGGSLWIIMNIAIRVIIFYDLYFDWWFFVCIKTNYFTEAIRK